MRSRPYIAYVTSNVRPARTPRGGVLVERDRRGGARPRPGVSARSWVPRWRMVTGGRGRPGPARAGSPSVPFPRSPAPSHAHGRKLLPAVRIVSGRWPTPRVPTSRVCVNFRDLGGHPTRAGVTRRDRRVPQRLARPRRARRRRAPGRGTRRAHRRRPARRHRGRGVPEPADGRRRRHHPPRPADRPARSASSRVSTGRR